VSAPGKLVLVGTPLGNRDDLSPRARHAILEADLLLCEDTRSPQRLLPDAPLPERRSCFVANEHERLALLRERLAVGQTVAFVSEAGLPVWSDPGRLLVAAAVDAGYEVDVIPGPTAGTCVLAASGFVAEGASFCGFIPRSGSARARVLDELVARDGASIIYEAGNRTPALLKDLAARAPDRRLVIGRELSKVHQEFIRGTLAEQAEALREPLRGEVTVVIEGAPPQDAEDDPVQQAARAVLDALLDPKLKPRARAKAVAKLTGQDAREIYDRLRRSSAPKTDPLPE